MSRADPRADFRPDINGLRGLSVALVVAYHLQLRGAGGGYLGVDVFFVISGYLMTQIVWQGLTEQRFDYAGFVAARIVRIVPALAALLAVLLAAGAVLLPPFDLRILGEQALWAAGFASNEFFRAGSGYITQGADTHWLLHTWSLSVEGQFYLLYPLLLMAAAGLLRVARAPASMDTRRRILLGVVVLLAAASLGWQARQLDADPDGSFFLLPSRAWELLIGGAAFLAVAGRSRAPGRWRVAASHAGVAIVLGSALLIAWLHLRPVGMGPLLLLPTVGVALVLWADHRGNALLRPAWLQALGRCSYSVYLWHWPLIVAVRITGLPLDHPRAATAATLAASLVAGWCSYRWIERPLLRRGGAASPRRVPVSAPAGLLLAGLLVGAAAFGIVASDGLAWRDRAGHEAMSAYQASVPPLYFPERCSNFRKPVAAMTVCPIEKDASRRLLVIGDSHAESLYAWFVAHSEVSVDFYSASECPPVPNFERVQPGYHCADYAARAWQLAGSDAYDTVVVAARWATPALSGPPYCHRQASGHCPFPASGEKSARVVDELRAAVERTLAAGKTVVMLDSTPEARMNVPEHVARERFWHGEVRSTIPRRMLAAQTAWMEPLLQQLSGRPGFHRVSLNEPLCTATDCRIFDPQLGRPIYIDGSHFDPVWMAQHGGVLMPFARVPAVR